MTRTRRTARGALTPVPEGGLGAAWYRSIKTVSRSGVRIERAVNEPVAALRCAIGVAVALFGALAWLGPVHAVLPALGALLTGMSSLLPGFRRGAALPAATALGLFTSALVGNAVAPWPVLFVAVLAAWAFAAALFWSLGTAAGMAAAMTVPVMLTIVAPPRDFADAVRFAVEIGAGGGVQVLLLLLWPGSSWGAQRGALADACASVADYARSLVTDPLAVFDPSALAQARAASVLTPRQAHSRPAELSGIRLLVDEARAALAAVADPGADPSAGTVDPGPEQDRVRDLLEAAAEVLDTAARSIRTGQVVPPSQALIAAMDEAARGEQTGEAAARAAERLIRLLTEVDGILRQTGEGEPTAGNRRGLHPPELRERFDQARRTYLRPLRGDSPVLRHAARVAVVVAATDGICKLLNVQHGYWAALTVMMVTRPDFSQTFSRGVARFAGTLVGVALASAVVLLAHPGQWVCAVLAAICAGTLCLVMRSGYLVASTLITGYIVFLLSMDGLALGSTVEERIKLTLLGGLLTFASYVLWPSWQTVTLAGRLAELITTTGAYAASVVEAVAAPGPAARRRVRESLLDTRDAYLSLESTALAAAAEPVRDRGPSRDGLAAAHAALARIFRAAIVLQTHLPPPDAPPRPAARAFARTLRDALEETAASVRGHRRISAYDFDDALAAWTGAADDTPAYLLQDAATLAAEARRLQDVLESLDAGADA